LCLAASSISPGFIAHPFRARIPKTLDSFMKIYKKTSFYLHSKSSVPSFKSSHQSAGFLYGCLLMFLLSMALNPGTARGCACGCGVFDADSSQMLPTQPGGMLTLEYDFQDQNRNWSGNSSAPAQNNDDKTLRTHFVTAGLLYMFNTSWGMSLDVPFANRYFARNNDEGDLVSNSWNSLGDIRLKGIYAGFSKDMSTGIDFGLKLPTGNWTYNNVDRDSQIGSGSVDFLVGAFHRQKLTPDNQWSWFAQVESDLPAFIQGGYRPGFEIDGAAGIQFNGWSAGREKCRPVLQVKASERTSDSGPAAANPVASGYQRVLIAPGVEFEVHPFKVYADIEIPVFEHVVGNQLVAPALFKVSVGYMF
jgi:hypothetical protein